MTQEKNSPTISRCKHDRENPYVMIRKSSLLDPNLSIESRGTLAYLLSLPDDWNINISHLKKTLNIGRDKAYSIINNLIECGYMIKEKVFEGNLKRGERYIISENKSFKTQNLNSRKCDAPQDRSPESVETQKHTNKYINTKYNINTNILPNVKDVADYILKKYNEYKKSIGEEQLSSDEINKNWITESKRLLKKNTKEELFSFIDLAFRDKFWKKVIKSPAGIRKNLNQLKDKLAEEKLEIINNKTETHPDLKKIYPVYERYKSWYYRITDAYYLDKGFLVLEKDCFYDQKNDKFKYNINFDEFIRVLEKNYKVPHQVITCDK